MQARAASARGWMHVGAKEWSVLLRYWVGVKSRGAWSLALLCACLALHGTPNPAWSEDRWSATKPDQLRLSDVEIRGKRRLEFVVLGEKVSSPESFAFPVYLPLATRETGDIEKTLGVSPKQPRETQAGRTTDGVWTLDAQVGSFFGHDVEVSYGDQFGNTSALLGLGHQMSQGHVDFSASRTEAFRAQGMWQRTPNTRVGLDLEIEDGTYEPWGQPLPRAERGARGYRGGAEVSRFFARSTELRLGARLDCFALSDGGAHTHERQGQAVCGTRSLWKGTLFEGRVRYLGGLLDRGTDQPSARWLAFEASAQRALGSAGWLAGLRGFSVRGYDGDKRNAVYPHVELTWGAKQVLGLRLFYTPEVGPASFRAGYLANPFIRLDGFLPVGDRRVAGGVEAALEVGRTLSLGGAVTYEEQTGFPVWVDSLGLWAAQPDRTAETTKLTLDATWQPLGTLKCELSSGIQGSVLSGGGGSEVPYVPGVFLGGAIRIEPRPGLGLVATARHEGKRPATVSGNDLDAYTLAGVQVSKTWGTHLRFLVGAKNLFDERYEIWKGYPMPKRTGYAGLEGRW